MGRPRRTLFQSAAYHVTARGNNRGEIFLDDDDRRAFLGLVAVAVGRFNLEVYAFCLMTNHYHLFLRTREANLDKAMHWINNRYTKRFLYRHSRTGHLFQSRYKAALIIDDAHWITLTHYIHLNPVRAGMVRDPASYKWSSFIDYTRMKNRHGWLDPDWILSRYGGSPAQRRRSYLKACNMLSGRGKHFWQEFVSDISLVAAENPEKMPGEGKEKSKDKDYVHYYLKPPRVDVDEELDKIARAFGVDKKELLKKRRDFTPKIAAYYHLVRNRGAPPGKVASALRVSPAAVNKGIGKCEDLMDKDKNLAALMRELS